MGLFGSRFLKDKNASGVTEKNINKIVDYTCILPTLTKKELEKKLCVAYKNRCYSICVNPVNVKDAYDYIKVKLKGALKLVCQVGFPLGESATETKVFELKKALQDGADEIDAMISISRIKSGDYSYVKNELTRLRRACKKHILKVIVETSVLTKVELSKVCSICAKCKIDFIETSSGFAGGGAELDDIESIKNYCGSKCEIKASGGIETARQAIIFVNAGATRIGTSREIWWNYHKLLFLKVKKKL